jgi:hypothetical protein
LKAPIDRGVLWSCGAPKGRTRRRRQAQCSPHGTQSAPLLDGSIVPKNAVAQTPLASGPIVPEEVNGTLRSNSTPPNSPCQPAMGVAKRSGGISLRRSGTGTPAIPMGRDSRRVRPLLVSPYVSVVTAWAWNRPGLGRGSTTALSSMTSPRFGRRRRTAARWEAIGPDNQSSAMMRG